MGVLWRRVSEAVRQAIEPVLPGRDQTVSSFTATSNQRNEAMYRDAVDFAVNVQVLEQDLQVMERHLAGQFAHLCEILQRPLPRAWDIFYDSDTQEDRLVPQGEQGGTIGRNVDVERLTEAMEAMRARMQGEVFTPLQNWMAVFKRVQVDMKRLEGFRLELDSRRRTVEGLEQRLFQQRERSSRQPMGPGQGSSVMPGPGNGRLLHRYHPEAGEPAAPAGADPKLSRQIQDTETTKARKEQKLRATLKQYQEQEERVFNSLHTLILDATRLREYAACSIGHMKDCLSMASAAFEGSLTSNPLMATAQFSTFPAVVAAAGAPMPAGKQQGTGQHVPLQIQQGPGQQQQMQQGVYAMAGGGAGGGGPIQQFDNPIAGLPSPPQGGGGGAVLPPQTHVPQNQQAVGGRAAGAQGQGQGQGYLVAGGSARYQGGQASQGAGLAQTQGQAPGYGQLPQQAYVQMAGAGATGASMTDSGSYGETKGHRRKWSQGQVQQPDSDTSAQTTVTVTMGRTAVSGYAGAQQARPKPAPPASGAAGAGAPRGRGAGADVMPAAPAVAARGHKGDREKGDREKGSERTDRDRSATLKADRGDQEWNSGDGDRDSLPRDNADPRSRQFDQYMHRQVGSGASGGGYAAAAEPGMAARHKLTAANPGYLAQQYVSVPVAQGSAAYMGGYSARFQEEDLQLGEVMRETGGAGGYGAGAGAVYRSPEKGMAGHGRAAAY